MNINKITQALRPLEYDLKINEIIDFLNINSTDTNLSNLSADGRAKFQYAPFSINNGTVDTNGNNITLSKVGDVPVQVDKYVVPELSANESEYGTTNNYRMTGTMGQGQGNTNPWTMALASDNYIPANAVVTFTISTNNYTGYPAPDTTYDIGCKGVQITYTYTDNTTEIILDENNTGNFANWNTAGKHSTSFALNVASKEVKNISVKIYSYYVSATGATPSAWNITFKAAYAVSSADTLICNPCTITTANSNTKTFNTDNLLNCSSVSNGTYSVMKSYSDGSLNLSSSFSVQKKSPGLVTQNWTQPVLTANGTMGGNSFAVDSSSFYNVYNAYYAFDGVQGSGNYWHSGTTASASNPQWISWYNPKPLLISQIVFYPGYVTTGKIQGSNDNSNWVDLTSEFTTSTGAYTVNLTGNTAYKYHRIYITYSSYGYVLISEIQITASEVISASPSAGDLWLDNSKYPLTLKQYNGSNWIEANELVYMGEITVNSGVITNIENVQFNKFDYLQSDIPVIIEKYQNGSSWYRMWSDGWCEQGGSFTPAAATTNITLLKPYANTNYFAIGNIQYASSTQYGQTYSKTADGFTMHTVAGYGNFDWIAKGYTVL